MNRALELAVPTLKHSLFTAETKARFGRRTSPNSQKLRYVRSAFSFESELSSNVYQLASKKKMQAAAYHHHLTSSTFHARGGRNSVNNWSGNFTVRMGLKEDGPSLAVVGVTGAVGQEFLHVLSDRDFPYQSIRMLASKRSAGNRLTFEDKEYIIEELNEDSFCGIDIALFSAGGSISKKFGPVAVSQGCIVIDNSSAFRMDEDVPLIIPEVNPQAMDHIKLGSGKGALIANPNCSTIICLMAATPLHRHAKVIRMVVSTYQAASGAGAAAMEELELQTREVLEGKEPTCKIFKQQYAFNLFSHNAPVLSNGYNEEEMKLVKETRKIWNDMNVKVTATCIRVPVMRAHAESVNLQFEKPLDEDSAREILRSAAGVVVIDERDSNHFPTPLEVSNKDDVAVGRIRQDVSQDGYYGLDIFICGDQIRKGAALNAIQIAELAL